MLTKGETRALYRKRARRYDAAMLLYRAAGFREHHYRKRAVNALALPRGGTVVDVGCGTGLNFTWLQEAVGPEGRIIGVDLTPDMLDQARERVRREGWRNVELVQCDASRYEFPEGMDGALSTLAITLIPEFDAVIAHAAKALRPGGRMVIVDFKLPDWPTPLVHLAAWITSPYGVSLDIADRHPWESIRRYLKEIEFTEYYLGALYLSVGEAARGA